MLAACREGANRPGSSQGPVAAPPEAGARDSAGTPRPGTAEADTPRPDAPRAVTPRAATSRADAPAIVFIGTSLTAGYGLDDPELAYPALLGRRIADAGYGYAVVNAGVSGDTSAGGRARLAHLLEQHGSRLAVLFVELGANDGLRGQSPEALYDNLGWIVRETRLRHPRAGIVIAGMQAPANLGASYTEAFRAVFGRIAEEQDALLIPFLLEGVGAVPALNQADGIHPNADGHDAVASHVWSLLAEYLAARCGPDGAC